MNRIEILNRTDDTGRALVGARGAYSPELIAIAKGLGGRWQAGAKTWVVPVEQGPELLRQLEAAGFELDLSLFSKTQANKAIIAAQAEAQTTSEAEAGSGLTAEFLAAKPADGEALIQTADGRVAIKTAYLTGQPGRLFAAFKQNFKAQLSWDPAAKIWWFTGADAGKVAGWLGHFAGLKAREI